MARTADENAGEPGSRVTDGVTDVRHQALEKEPRRDMVVRPGRKNRKAREMASITKLGFVLNAGAAQPLNIVGRCFIEYEERGGTDWFVYSPGRGAFFQRLFLLAQLAYRLLSRTDPDRPKERKQPSDLRPLIEHDDPSNGFLINYLFDIKTRLKESQHPRYQGIPKRLQSAVNKLFVTRGQKKTAILGVPQDIQFTDFIFLTEQDFARYFPRSLGTDQAPGTEIRYSCASADITSSNSLLGQLPELADRLRFAMQRKPPTWIGLYLGSRPDGDYDPGTQRWIEMKAREFLAPSNHNSALLEGPARASSRQYSATPPLNLHDILARHNNVLLTGPAGAGKTTALTLLHASFLGQTNPDEDDVVPFFVGLKFFERLIRAAPASSPWPDIADAISCSVCNVLRSTRSAGELQSCADGIRPVGRSRDHLPLPDRFPDRALDVIKQEITQWFRKPGVHLRNVLVLLDGFNDVSDVTRAWITSQVAALWQSPAQVVVSCRSYHSDYLAAGDATVQRFELQPINDQHIVSHLATRGGLGANAEAVFASQVRPFPGMLSLLRNPFFLDHLAQHFKAQKGVRITRNRSAMISGFVSASRDRVGDNRGAVNQPTLNYVLGRVAFEMLARTTYDSARGPLRFPQDCQTLCPGQGHVSDILAAGEAYGLLTKSGMFAEANAGFGALEFSHDYFRDYFVALHLIGLDRNDLLACVPALIEYFAWDEPLVMFFELCTDPDLAHDVLSLVLKKDPFLGALCAGSCVALQEKRCVEVASHLLRSTGLGATWIGPNVLPQARLREIGMGTVRQFASYALSHIPVRRLTEMAERSSQEPLLLHAIWTAISDNATFDDFPELKRLCLGALESGDDYVAILLLALQRMPSREIFEWVLTLRTRIASVVCPTMPDMASVYCVSRCLDMTLSEVQRRCSYVDDPYLFSGLLNLVSHVEDPELPLLDVLARTIPLDNAAADSVVGLLLRARGVHAMPILRARWREVASDGLLSMTSFARRTMLKAFLDVEPSTAASIVIRDLWRDLCPRDDVLRLAGGGQGDAVQMVRQLASTRVSIAIRAIVRFACMATSPSVVVACIDEIEQWPDRGEAIGMVRSCALETASPQELMRADLIGAALGEGSRAKLASLVFEDVYSVAIAPRKLMGSLDDRVRAMYDCIPHVWSEWHEEDVSGLFVLALRAVGKSRSWELGKRIVKVIEVSESPVVIMEAIRSFKAFVVDPAYGDLVREVLGGDWLRCVAPSRFLKMGYSVGECSEIAGAVQDLCESMPCECVSEVCEMFFGQYELMVAECDDDRLLWPAGSLGTLSGILLSLVRLAPEPVAVVKLRRMKAVVGTLKGKRREEAEILLENMKFARGRRLCAELAE
jgi:hypothetical protein